MSIPVALLKKKADLLVEATERILTDVQQTEEKIVRTVVFPLIQKLQTEEGKLTPTAHNYTVAGQIRSLVNREINGPDYQAKVRKALESLNEAYALGVQASRRMDPTFSVNPDTQKVLNEYRGSIVKTLSTEVLGEKISRTATDKFILAISTQGTTEGLTTAFQ